MKRTANKQERNLHVISQSEQHKEDSSKGRSKYMSKSKTVEEQSREKN